MKFKPLVGNLFLGAAIVASIVSCNASSQTQNVDSDPETCKNAIASVKRELERVKKDRVKCWSW